LLVCPNHSDVDYHDFLVDMIFWSGASVTSSGSSLRCTFPMIFSYFFRRVVFYVVMSMLVVGPIFFVANTLGFDFL
jgi:hypothetical protein